MKFLYFFFKLLRNVCITFTKPHYSEIGNCLKEYVGWPVFQPLCWPVSSRFSAGHRCRHRCQCRRSTPTSARSSRRPWPGAPAPSCPSCRPWSRAVWEASVRYESLYVVQNLVIFIPRSKCELLIVLYRQRPNSANFSILLVADSNLSPLSVQ